MKHATVKDVAKLAGVSCSTVSLVINNSPKVSPETKKNVQKAIETLNYVPNNYAAALRQKPKPCIGVLVPDVSNPYYIEIIRGIKDRCNSEEVSLQISETRYDLKTEEKAIEFLKSIRTTGYIFVGTANDDDLIEDISKDHRVVFVDKTDTLGKFVSVFIDNRQSMYQATSYLLNKDLKDIWYISQFPNTEPLKERLGGFKDAMTEYNINPDNNIILSYESYFNKLESGYNLVKSLLSTKTPEAIITCSDLIALGAIRAIYESGLSCPSDISVIGFDNIDFSRYSIPSLTTINQPKYQMGEIAYSYLLQENLSVNSLNNKIVLKSDFIIRDSVKK